MLRHFYNGTGLPHSCNAYDDGKDSVAGTSGNGGQSVGSPSGVDNTTNGYGGHDVGGSEQSATHGPSCNLEPLSMPVVDSKVPDVVEKAAKQVAQEVWHADSWKSKMMS